ncbi:MAG: ATP-binding protein, partial [Candidatus Desantisbacteria bacterium]
RLSYENNQELPIKIRIKDNGPGIHKEYFERIFDILFSTKPDGTGMGLHLCRDMIQPLGGRIDVEESVIFGGTTFLIELPDKG